MSDLELALVKYNKKTWRKSALLGFIIGLAVIVPGISGSTVAIIFKLYDQFVYAMGNLLKDFKRCFAFLLPIGIGAVIGVALGFLGVKGLVEAFPFAIVCLFSGLMIGAFPAVKSELKGAAVTPLRVGLLLLGVMIPVAIGVLSVWIESRTPALIMENNQFSSINYRLILALPIGYILGITQIVPGLSASALLMSLGWFNDLVQSVGLHFWLENPEVFLYYAMLGLGFLTGLLTFSKILSILFEKTRESAYFMIVGLSLGSIVSMFFNSDIVKVYLSWQGGINWLELISGLSLLIVGGICSYLLVLYQRKRGEKQ